MLFANYLTAALRSLWRARVSAVINILGLAIGLAACLLIVLFVNHEFSYDKAFSDVESLYRIESTANIPGQDPNASPSFFGPAYDLLANDYAEIELVARLQGRGGTVVSGDNAIPQIFRYADPEFLELFDFPILEGTRSGALDDPSSIVLTREMAVKHLGEGPWLGREITINETIERTHVVTAVIETLPGNTHFDIDFIVPIDRRVYEATGSAGSTDLDRWNGLPFNVYFKLAAGHDVANVRATINDWVDGYFPAQIQALVGINGSELFTPRILPVSDIHMFSPAQFDMRPPGSINTIYGFTGIALLILTIACINFVNLATAASTLRAKEVAVRKVMGAKRWQLFVQFEVEALVTAFIALLIALAALEALLPAFADYTLRELSADALLNLPVLGTAVMLTMIVGLLAGAHPALVLSAMQPARVLGASRSGVGGRAWVRQALVIFQFTISTMLIITTALIYVQTEHARNIDMGYDNEHTLSLQGLGDEAILEATETLREQVMRFPGVTEASLTNFTPGDNPGVGLSLKVPGQEGRTIIFFRSVYPEFFPQFGVSPVAGRLLSHEHQSDRTVFIDDPNSLERQDVNVVINEAAVRKLGHDSAQAAIGQVFYRGRENQIVNTIVGVIPNTHFGSPRADIDAEIYMFIPRVVNELLVSYKPGDFEPVRRAIDELMARLYPRVPTQTEHLQENIAQQYREEEVQGTLLGMFAALAVVVACMGLYGLSSFTIARRTREIGIRKVMGASSRQIAALVLAQFSRPVLLANLLAWPVCWIVVSRWQEAFTQRIDLLPWFAAATIAVAFLTLSLAWATVGTHALRVARTSPVHALRYE